MELILEGGAAVNGRRISQSEVPMIMDKVELKKFYRVLV